MTGPKRYKLCTSCGESKSVDEFYRRKTGYLDRWCKPCSKADVARRKSEKRRLAREARLALPAPTEKRCRKCNTVKPVAEYYVDPRGRVRMECDDCRKEYLRQWYAKSENRARVSANGKSYEANNQDRARIRRLSKYGLTPEQYDAMYDTQQGCCAICGARQDRAGNGKVGGGDVLCVDHVHDETRAVRGLLCTGCNRGIGLLGDDPSRLAAAINYLLSRRI